jgi:hypothetical protein
MSSIMGQLEHFSIHEACKRQEVSADELRSLIRDPRCSKMIARRDHDSNYPLDYLMQREDIISESESALVKDLLRIVVEADRHASQRIGGTAADYWNPKDRKVKLSPYQKALRISTDSELLTLLIPQKSFLPRKKWPPPPRMPQIDMFFELNSPYSLLPVVHVGRIVGSNFPAWVGDMIIPSGDWQPGIMAMLAHLARSGNTTMREIMVVPESYGEETKTAFIDFLQHHKLQVLKVDGFDTDRTQEAQAVIDTISTGLTNNPNHLLELHVLRAEYYSSPVNPPSFLFSGLPALHTLRLAGNIYLPGGALDALCEKLAKPSTVLKYISIQTMDQDHAQEIGSKIWDALRDYKNRTLEFVSVSFCIVITNAEHGRSISDPIPVMEHELSYYCHWKASGLERVRQTDTTMAEFVELLLAVPTLDSVSIPITGLHVDSIRYALIKEAPQHFVRLLAQLEAQQDADLPTEELDAEHAASECEYEHAVDFVAELEDGGRVAKRTRVL